MIPHLDIIIYENLKTFFLHSEKIHFKASIAPILEKTTLESRF